MAYLTDRKRAAGMGSARNGTQRHWFMTVTSYSLLILLPFFIFIIGCALGQSQAEVRATFSHPFPAIVVIMTLAVGMMHFRAGIRMVIEDYTHGFARELWIIAMNIVAYGLAAGGIFAVLKMAL